MDGEVIFCCSNKIHCNNYRNDESVKFRFIHTGLCHLVSTSKTKICWGFLLEGELEIRGKKEVTGIKAGEMFLLPSSNYKVSALSENTGLLIYTSDRPVECCSILLGEVSRNQEEIQQGIVKAEIREPLGKFVQSMIGYLESGADCSSLFELKQRELFVLVKALYSKDILTRFFYTLTHNQETDLKKLLKENCFRAKSVEELARLCGYSLNGFKRVFKELYHDSIYQWMLQQRADFLKERLSEEDVNLKRVIDEFGFSSPAHFTKFCKQWLGMAPTKFIKKIKSQRENLEL